MSRIQTNSESTRPTADAANPSAVVQQLIDVNIYHSRWPLRRLQCDEPAKLRDKLKSIGVTQAWVGSFDALLHRDMGAVNLATVQVCSEYAADGWLPVGSINPMLPDWEEELRRCHEQYKMKCIRLHPNYHGYKISELIAEAVCRQAADRGLLVQVALSMEDVRTQNPIVFAERVDPKPMVKLQQAIPTLRVMWLNFFHGGPPATAQAIYVPDRTWFDIATLEGIEGCAKLVNTVSPDAVVFGTYSPLFYSESSLLKLAESALADSVLDRIRSSNALRALAP